MLRWIKRKLGLPRPKFKVGDRVVVTNNRGAKVEYVIRGVFHKSDRTPYYAAQILDRKLCKSGEWWSDDVFTEDRCTPWVPPTPFEAKLHAYIQRELG